MTRKQHTVCDTIHKRFLIEDVESVGGVLNKFKILNVLLKVSNITNRFQSVNHSWPPTSWVRHTEDNTKRIVLWGNEGVYVTTEKGGSQELVGIYTSTGVTQFSSTLIYVLTIYNLCKLYHFFYDVLFLED